MPSFNLCAIFSLFPDNTQFGRAFSLAGFNFLRLGGTRNLFVNSTNQERGLSFPTEGVEIVLPTPSKILNIRIGTFAEKVDIAVVDTAGTLVGQQSIPNLNAYTDVRLSAPEIALVRLLGGGNEGIIVSACVVICT